MQDFSKPGLPSFGDGLVGFHFAVVFLVGGVIPNPVDFRFKKVSGLSSRITTATINEGGENLYSHKLPQRVEYDNLILERGMATGSPLSLEFNVAMSAMQFNPGNVLVALLDDNGLPAAAWLFWKAYPVRWNVSDLDADNNSLVIETMELAYTRFQTMRV